MSNSEIIGQIVAFHRQRCFVMEQRKRCDLALGAFLRMVLGWSKALPETERKRIAEEAAGMMETDSGPWADVISVSRAARDPFEELEQNITKQMEVLAEQLPVWSSFGESIRGFSSRGLAVIVGEAGDLGNYSTIAKLWKRMGVAVIDGVRQGGLDKNAAKEDWIAHGYKAKRRSHLFVIGDVLIKSNRDGKYRTCYLRRKEVEIEKAIAAGLQVLPAAKIPKARADEFVSEIKIHRRAQRYMEKRLLRDLWQAWRRTVDDVADGPLLSCPPPSFSEAAE